MQRSEHVSAQSSAPSRRAQRQNAQRHRRAQRELQQALRERAERQAIPRRDEGPLPRID